jgi:predicted ATPase
VSDPTLVAQIIAETLGAMSVHEAPLDDLQRFLQSRSLLLVLDNFEVYP